jgi:dTDP-4-amino-4,6-dideoxygalactose transaminase
MRKTYLPFCLPSIGEEEIAEVADSMRSGWITTGPKVKRFEEEFAAYVGCAHAVAVSSCTAGLHVALTALGIGQGDEVILPTMTFCATANVVVHLGAKPVLVDVKPDFQIDPACVRRAITPRTRAIMPVHYAGQACELDEILDIGVQHRLAVVEDAAHAAGALYRGKKIGTHGHAVAFSFYATKNLTTGEGGMVTTADPELAGRMRLLSLHGMTRDAWKRYTRGAGWEYDVRYAGYKYNMTDIQASIGIHQLHRLDNFIRRRQEIAATYDAAFANLPEVHCPVRRDDRSHVYHLYPVQLDGNGKLDRCSFIAELATAEIGCSVHFIPVHRHSFYREVFGYRTKEFPVAEKLYRGLVSLPLYPKMSEADTQDVVEAVQTAVLRSRSAPVITRAAASA